MREFKEMSKISLQDLINKVKLKRKKPLTLETER
jgi:hypothetical protein